MENTNEIIELTQAEKTILYGFGYAVAFNVIAYWIIGVTLN